MMHILVDMEDLTLIEKELGMLKDKSKMVLRTSINNTAKTTRLLLVQEAKKQYAIRDSREVNVARSLDIIKATAGNLEAYVTSVGSPTNTIDFDVSPFSVSPRNRPKAGHSVRVIWQNSKKVIKYGTITRGGAFTDTTDDHKAFTVKFKSGHKAIAQRVPGSRRATPRKDHPRGEEAIKTLYSPSIPKMLGNEETVFGVVKPKIEDELIEQIQIQIARYLRK